MTLKKDLFSSAHELGSAVISNRRITGDLTSRSIKCAVLYHAVRKSIAMTVDDNKQLRKVTLDNNRKNNRNLGKGGPGAPRMTKLHAPGQTCKFGFYIKWDEYGYYINLN